MRRGIRDIGFLCCVEAGASCEASYHGWRCLVTDLSVVTYVYKNLSTDFPSSSAEARF